jgi:multidrug efflux pump subunit AcrA (membrane-fusion protein)
VSVTEGRTDPTEAALQGLGDAQELARQARDACRELRAIVDRADTPAQLQTITLDAVTPVHRDEVRDTSLSIGIINPTDYILRLGLAGASASPQARGIPVPPNAAIVMPVAAEDLEIGLDYDTNAGAAATVGSDTVVVYLLRFKAVQPFHLHRY